MKITEFCTKLEKADARSEFVIAVFCDIRDFSSFSKTVESADTSTFLKHFYLKLLTNYFQDAVFAKPAGDGLLLVFRHNEANLLQISEKVISQCFKALKDFPRLFNSIPILNYSAPVAVGFGIARGSASVLQVGDEILDYSGRTLNLAARLNELAHPTGVVIDANYQTDVIPKRFRLKFKGKSVFIRGIAEEVPLRVFISEQVSVPVSALYPIKEPEWRLYKQEFTVKEALDFDAAKYSLYLPDPPLNPQAIRIEIRWQNPKVPSTFLSRSIEDFSNTTNANGYEITFAWSQLREWIKSDDLKPEGKVIIMAHYIPKRKMLQTNAGSATK